MLIFLCVILGISGRQGNIQSSDSQQTYNPPQSSDPDESSESVSSDPPESSYIEESFVHEEKSILGFLKTAAKPIGHTMYVWGGGWNEEDTGAGIEATTIGLGKNWAKFAAEQTAEYDYEETTYQIHDGLDCSGYIGWAIYNTLEDEDGQEGYVMSSTLMAKTFADMGFGSYVPAYDVTVWQAGDIMSMTGHAWIVVGSCSDGSVVMMHSSPPGVILCGTKLQNGRDSEAVRLAEKYMKEYFPEWYEKFPDCARDYSYLTGSSKMHWNRETLSDDEDLRHMSAGEVLKKIFE